MKGSIKSNLGRAMFSLSSRRVLLKNVAVVVAFHRVNSRAETDGLTCSVEMFRQYCGFFSEHFNVIPLRDVVEKMENGRPLNGELSITFDDGYRDNFENAAPVLKDIGLPATFFVVSRFIDTGIVPWWDSKLHVRHPWMTWDHVRQLYEGGFEIGAHTRTHANLGQVTGQVAWKEIVGSRNDLEQKLGARVGLFAYPYGKTNDITEETRDMVREAGFRCCCSCFGKINTRQTDPFYLRRIPIGSWHETPYHFAFNLAFRTV